MIKKYQIKKINFLSIFILVLLASCASRQDLVYFQDEPITDSYNKVLPVYDLTYKIGDLLTIDVSALDPETVKPFNLPAVSYNSSVVVNATGNLKMQTYLIDNQGNIDFPVLGTIHLESLTRTQATKLFKEKLTEYVKDPLVNIRLANFTITILGEVNKPGTYIIQDESVTLTKALGLAGDLTIYGQRNNVFLIRENNGIKQYAKLDLTSVNVLQSPNYYYLAQNDVIYVEPNDSRVKQSRYNQNNTIIISAVATLTAIVAILLR